jgi:hypothetical protein
MKTAFIIILAGIICIQSAIFIEQKREIDSFHDKIHQCIHAPTPIEVGDSLYIVRYYPLYY